MDSDRDIDKRRIDALDRAPRSFEELKLADMVAGIKRIAAILGNLENMYAGKRDTLIKKNVDGSEVRIVQESGDDKRPAHIKTRKRFRKKG